MSFFVWNLSRTGQGAVPEWLAIDAGRQVTLCDDTSVVQGWQDAVAAARSGVPAFPYEQDLLDGTSKVQRLTFHVNWHQALETAVTYEYLITQFPIHWAIPLGYGRG